MELEVVKSISDLFEVEEQWEFLLKNSGCDLAFSSFAWYVGCCSISKSQPRVFLLRDERRIKAILPLIKFKSNGCLQFVSNLSDYNDVIALRSDHMSVEILLDKILDNTNDHEKICLSDVREGSLLLCAIDRLEFSRGLIISRRISYSYAVEIPGLYQDYLSHKSRAFKEDLRRKHNRAIKRGLIVQTYQPEEEKISELLDCFLNLHKKRIKNSILLSPGNEKIVRQVIRDLLNNGVFVAFVVRHGAELLAIQLSVRNDRYLGYWNGGFDCNISDVSPGKLLFQRQIEFCVQNNIQEFDLMRGEENYKKSWSTKKGKTISVVIDRGMLGRVRTRFNRGTK